MDISQYAVGAESIDFLSEFQINNFFRQHPSITKEECHRTAAGIVGGPVSATLVQGGGSYTVAGDSAEHPKVVQFRHSALDLTLMGQARLTYPGSVPEVKSRGMLADAHVYEMDLVPGAAFVRIRRNLFTPGMEQRLLRTVQDFARFFASAWLNRPALELPPDHSQKLLAHYSRILDKLSQGLPERFLPKLDEARQGLPLMFRPGYPMVLNHNNLLEMSIHMGEDTGHITGMAGWADAEIAPFGMSVGGLETVLGVQTTTAWRYHPSQDYLRAQFWETFYEAVGDLPDIDRRAIEAARLLGLFRANAFNRRAENEEDEVPVKEGGYELVLLDAILPVV